MCLKKSVFFLVLCLVTLGCSNFLEVENNQVSSISDQFKDYRGVKQALAGVYFKTEAMLSDQQPFIYGDLQGGNLTFTPNTSGSNLGIIEIPSLVRGCYSFGDRATDSDFASTYSACYQIINNINNILFYTDKISDATDAQKSQLKAEALAARAFLHFQLLQLYGQTYNFSANASHKGIVYANRILVGGVDFPARNSVAECYSLIVADLQNAIATFTSQQTFSGPFYSYFNAKTTNAFLARVALQKRDYNLAILAASSAVSASGVSLMTSANYVSEWQKPNVPPSETLLEFSAPNDATIPNFITSTVAQYYKVPLSASDTPGDYACSSDLYSLFETADIRKNNFITVNLQVKNITGQLQSKPFYFTKKFQDNAGTMVMRLSEMYLILAEANARLGNAAIALLNLNIIRERANLSLVTNNGNLLDEILLERRRELCFEGSYFFDLMRFNRNVLRNDCIGLQCNLTFPNPKMVLPIPFQSINVNQNIIQNESY